MSNPTALVPKLWNYCNILRDVGVAFRQPRGRKTIAQRFNAGFPGGRGTSPVRDERNRWHCIADSFAPPGLMGF